MVESRRSGDVWLKNGDAVDRKGKLSRAMSMLAPKPPMSVIPPEEVKDETRPPSPIRVPGDSLNTILVMTRSPAHSEASAEFGRLRSSSRSCGSRSSFSEESRAARIMVAQRHYSALAQTIAVSPGSVLEKQEHEVVNASGAVVRESTSHLRTRSATTSFSGPESPDVSDISLPPPFPLPPTPPSVRAARQLQSSHSKSSSSGYSFGPIDSVNEIDELSAGVLPLLVPGLKIGDDVKVGPYGPSPSSQWNQRNSSSPELQTTLKSGKLGAPTQRNNVYQGHHRSLANLGLGKDSIQTNPYLRASSSIAPPSAASSESQFEAFEAELEQNPHYHSTPQLARPSVPLAPKGKTRSSIAYIRSENVASSATVATSESAAPAPQPDRESFIQRSARAGQSLIPKASMRKSRIKSKNTEAREPISGRGQGLRPLTLLRDKDTNSVKSSSSRESRELSEGRDEPGDIRPPTLGRRQKARRLMSSVPDIVQDENDCLAQEEAGEALGTLKGLARSDTNRQRAILRRTEVLPKLVIRPPSTTYDAY